MSAQDRVFLERHIDHCEKCHYILNQEQQLNLRIKDGCKLLDGTWERIETRINTLPPYSSYPRTQTTLEREQISFFPFRPLRIALTVASVALLVFVGVLGYQWYTSKLSSLQVRLLLGPPSLRKSQDNPVWDKLDITTKLQRNDQIQTDEYSLVSLKLGKLGQVWLNNSTKMTLCMNRSTTLILYQGEIYVSAAYSDKKFRVSTPIGWVEVYGTDFNIAVDTALRTVVTCLQDTVFFENSLGQVIIPAGYQAIVAANTQLGEPQLVDVNSVVEWKLQFDQFTKLSDQEREQLRKKYISLGNQLYDQQRYEEAITNDRKAVLVDSKYFSAYYCIGRSYLALGEYAQATSGYILALKRSPKEYYCLFQLARCLIELHQYADAERYATQLTTFQPSNHGGWVLLGELAMLQGNFTKAREMYQHAKETGAESCPNCGPRMHAALAEIARQQKDFQTAQAELAKAEKYNPNRHPGIFYAITARLAHDLKNTGAEESAWQSYLRTDPRGGYAQEAELRLAVLKSAS